VSAALHLRFVATSPVSALLFSDVCPSLISSCRAGSTLGKTQVVWFDRLSHYFIARDLLVCRFMNTIIITLIKSDSRQGGLRGSSWLVRPSMNFNAYYSIAYALLLPVAVGQSWCCSIVSLLSSTPRPKQGPENSHDKTYHYKRLVASPAFVHSSTGRPSLRPSIKLHCQSLRPLAILPVGVSFHQCYYHNADQV
jgi:hypothetical protein